MDRALLELRYAALLGDDRFDTLAQTLHQPNIFEILRIAHYEIRHSNFLAWLLDPNGTHGLGNFFLTKFLKDAFIRSRSSKISVAEVVSLSTDRVKIYREWNSIDILIEFSNLVLVIENKVWSGEHDEQLKRYKKTIESNFPHHRHFFVFLTPYGQEASMPDIFISYTYAGVISILEMVIRVNETGMNTNTQVYVKDYIKSLKLHIMGNSEANDLAKKIYYSHKDLFDFIIANQPDPISEIHKALKRRVESKGWVMCSPGGQSFVRFLTPALNSLIARDAVKGWPKKEAFLFEIYLNFAPRKLRIYCTLPPADFASRRMLKHGLDKAYGEAEDKNGWITYYDEQVSFNALEVASKGPEAIELFVDQIWPIVEKMVQQAEAVLIPILSKN